MARILIVTDLFPPQFFGGMATHAYNIARFLAERHQVLVITPRKTSATCKSEPFEVAPALTMRFPIQDGLILRRQAQRFGADVVHVCNAGLAYSLLSQKFPVVTRVVGNDFLRPWCGFNLPLRSILYRLLGSGAKVMVNRWETRLRQWRVLHYLRKSHSVVANSSWTKDRLLEHGVAPERIETIVGGVDTDLFHPTPDKTAVRLKVGVPPNAMILLTAANLVMKKGVDLILHAMPELSRKWPDLLYVVVGEGVCGGQYKLLSQDLGLDNRVLFVGRKNQQELSRFYQAADIYVQISRNHELSHGYIDVETMGRTYFEAGACGIPVIAANVGGVPSVVVDGVNGVLVQDSENRQDVSQKIDMLLQDGELRKRLGAAGLKKAREEFDWPCVGARFERLLLSCIDRDSSI